jgi:DNA-binding MarR family transcriptional regulator
MNPADHRAYFFKIDTTIKKIRQTLQKKIESAGLGITVDQWVLLDHIYRNEGIAQIELAELTAKDGPTVTRILDLLHKKRLIERRMAEDDRRKFKLFATSEGKALFDKAFPIVAEVRQIGWGNLSEEDYLTFVRILDSIHRNITQHD